MENQENGDLVLSAIDVGRLGSEIAAQPWRTIMRVRQSSHQNS
jgi:hypothetical protein